jgi:allantoin racemase
LLSALAGFTADLARASPRRSLCDREGSGVPRVLYLSLSNERYSPNYFPFLRRYIGSVAADGTEVELRGTRVDIPVMGLGETSMLTACLMGSQFSLVGVNRHFGGRFEENVARYGLGGRLAGIECMDLTPHELDRCYSDEAEREHALQSLRAAARITLSRGAEVVIPAGGRLTAFLNANRVRDVDGAPVLDGTATLIAMTEAAIRIRGAAGTVVSRRRLYARASAEVIAAAAGEYAESYRIPALAKLAADAGDASSPGTAGEAR